LARLGLQCVAWSLRSLDTIDRRPTRVASRVAQRLVPGSIVLMHDGIEGRRRTAGAAPSVVGALPLVLATIRERGWRSVTLSSALAA